MPVLNPARKRQSVNNEVQGHIAYAAGGKKWCSAASVLPSGTRETRISFSSRLPDTVSRKYFVVVRGRTCCGSETLRQLALAMRSTVQRIVTVLFLYLFCFLFFLHVVRMCEFCSPDKFVRCSICRGG